MTDLEKKQRNEIARLRRALSAAVGVMEMTIDESEEDNDATARSHVRILIRCRKLLED